MKPSQPGGLPRLYRPEEVADALGCSEWWVKEQARRKRIPFTKAGGAYRFTAEHYAAIVALFSEGPAEASSPPATKPAAAPKQQPRSIGARPVARLQARRPRRGRGFASDAGGREAEIA